MTTFDLVIANGRIVEDDDQIVGIFDYVDECDIRTLLRSPLAMVPSDGLVMPPVETLDDPALFWPCSYGEYPGVLERGVLRPGLRADIVVFDLDRVRDRATNLHPHRYPFESIPQCHPEGLVTH